MFINRGYFIGAVTIAGRNNLETKERLDLFISKYEDEFLQDVLGYALFKAFKAGTAGFDIDGSNATIAQKWLNLLEGAEYIRYNETIKYPGLLINTGAYPQSPIANYIYFKWAADAATQTTGMGETISKAENAATASPIVKQVRAWNEMIDGVWALWEYLNANKETYDWKAGGQNEYWYEPGYGWEYWGRNNPSYCRNTFRKINVMGI